MSVISVSAPNKRLQFKVNNRSTRNRCVICSKLTMNVICVVLLTLQLTLNTRFSCVSIDDFEQVFVCWVERDLISCFCDLIYMLNCSKIVRNRRQVLYRRYFPTKPITSLCCLSIPLEKIRKPLAFLMFSGGIDKQHRAAMG